MSLGKAMDREEWSFPERTPLSGRYIELQPLSAKHLDDLWMCAKDAPDSFTYLRYGPFDDREHLKSLIADLSSRDTQPFWAVIGTSGRAEGWLSICDVYQDDGAFEIGSIWFSPALQGSRESREAIFLLMCLGMDDLQYERLVWRCQAQNAKSFRAALNLGFTHEGTWRRAMIIKNWQRDVAWFSILRDEWPLCRDAFEKWLNPENFDAQGRQIVRLQDFRSGADDR